MPTGSPGSQKPRKKVRRHDHAEIRHPSLCRIGRTQVKHLSAVFGRFTPIRAETRMIAHHRENPLWSCVFFGCSASVWMKRLTSSQQPKTFGE
jgi:hypothetical protein